MAATIHLSPAGSRRHLTPQAPTQQRRGRSAASVYWRRRLAVGLALVVFGAGLWTVATWVANSSVGVDRVGADRAEPLVEEIYVVQPGDTLWTIAAEVDTDGDVRDTVDWLAERNGGSAITAGQRIVIGR